MVFGVFAMMRGNRTSKISVRWREIATKCGIAGLASLIAVLIAEVLLPFVIDLEEPTLQYDHLLGFRGRPNLHIQWSREMGDRPRLVTTNSQGFHDIERTLDPNPESYRILFLGDSFLEGYQVEIEANFSQQVAGMLLQARHEKSVEALNLGVHGYGLGTHYLNVRHRIEQWSPDAVVLVLFLGNDLQDNFMPLASFSVPRFDLLDGSLVFTPAPPHTARIWLRDEVFARSAIARLFWMRVIKSIPAMMEIARNAGMVATPDGFANKHHHLQDMITVAQRLFLGIRNHLLAMDTKLFVYIIPDPLLVQDVIDIRRFNRDFNSTKPMYRKGRQWIETKTLAILDSLQVRYAYPRESFIAQIESGNQIYRGGYGHFTALGHKLSAQLIAEHVAPMLIKKNLGNS